ncbi:IucA/IucC family protein [Arenicella sp. 4NH20-0111]|uniref:IucA/IucC family protein n=1 Tax=Arenicella sp. 4NH20-0111 TaxID=3127648 RepID=UPI00310BD693
MKPSLGDFSEQDGEAMMGFAYAASSFANAMLKESSNWTWLESHHEWWRAMPEDTDPLVKYPLTGNRCLLIPIASAGQASVYRCYQSWWYASKTSLKPIGLVQAAQLLCQEGLDREEEQQAAVLPSRVQQSVSEVQKLMERRRLNDVFSVTSNFIDSDQALLGGHPSHPCPRAKGGFSDQDSVTYSPEHQGKFALRWLAVAPSVVFSECRGESLERRLWSIVESDAELTGLSKRDFGADLPWPLHPWQAEKLLQEPRVKQLISDGLIRDFGERGDVWTATSSLRCIYRRNSPYMLKYSLSVQLTNSVRHLLPHEVERGLQVVDVWDSELGRAFSERYPSFSVIREPAWLALKDENGQPMINTITVLRDNLFTEGHDQQVFMLGSLCQLPPAGKTSQLANIIKAKATLEKTSVDVAARDWYQRFLMVALEPLLMAQAEEGLLFGAHQQNTLLKLRDFNPDHFYYRDCQGTGFSALGVQRHQTVVAAFADNRNQLNETMANNLFSYYLVVNTLFATVAAISQDGLLNESELLTSTHQFIDELRRRNPKDTSCLDMLLESDFLHVKGNLLCSLRDTNENTMTNPLELYLPLNNPLKLSRSA